MAVIDPLVVIVAYQNTPALAAALEALDGYRAVLVVDNGVDDQVRELVNGWGAEYTTLGRNAGFAAAVNAALTRRRGRDVLLLNPDARISPAAIAELVKALHEDPDTCAIAPRLEGEDGNPQRVVWPIPSPKEQWVDAASLRRFFPPRSSFIIGAVLLLRGKAIDDVGGFDERFFLYGEECDWQLRAIRRGWRIRLADHVTARHDGGGSSAVERVRIRQSLASARLFGLKWYGTAGWASMRTASMVGAAARLLVTFPVAERRARYVRQLWP